MTRQNGPAPRCRHFQRHCIDRRRGKGDGRWHKVSIGGTELWPRLNCQQGMLYGSWMQRHKVQWHPSTHPAFIPGQRATWDTEGGGLTVILYQYLCQNLRVRLHNHARLRWTYLQRQFKGSYLCGQTAKHAWHCENEVRQRSGKTAET